MGFLTRLLIPRSVSAAPCTRREPSSAPSRPRASSGPDEYLTRSTTQSYGVARSLNTKKPQRKPFYRHETCTIRHRTPEAAAKCRRAY